MESVFKKESANEKEYLDIVKDFSYYAKMNPQEVKDAWDQINPGFEFSKILKDDLLNGGFAEGYRSKYTPNELRKIALMKVVGFSNPEIARHTFTRRRLHNKDLVSETKSLKVNISTYFSNEFKNFLKTEEAVAIMFTLNMIKNENALEEAEQLLHLTGLKFVDVFNLKTRFPSKENQPYGYRLAIMMFILLYTKRTNGVGLLSKAEKLGLLKDYPNLTNSNLYKRMYTVFTPEALALVRGKGRKMKEEEKEELE